MKLTTETATLADFKELQLAHHRAEQSSEHDHHTKEWDEYQALVMEKGAYCYVRDNAAGIVVQGVRLSRDALWKREREATEAAEITRINGPLVGFTCMYEGKLKAWIAKVYLQNGATIENAFETAGLGYKWIYRRGGIEL